MGVYRSDQAQLTFAAEAAQGGDPEMIEANVAGVTARLSAAANAGDRSISINTVASGTLAIGAVSYTHLRDNETSLHIV